MMLCARWPFAPEQERAHDILDRLAKFDVSRRFSRARSRVAVQLGFGVVCAIAMMVVRSGINYWAPSSGPFALVYPTVLLATLYGHWQAGTVAWLVSFLWAWYFVLTPQHSFQFFSTEEPQRVLLNGFAALIVLVFAETFRRAVQKAASERDREIERRTTLLAEIEHRTKNNFALVASLLEIQKRREPNPETAVALDDAIGRVHSFAAAYSNLATMQEEGSHVHMRPYLTQLVQHISKAAFPGNVTVDARIAELTFQREMGVAIGLYVNEALTNCAKYAFPDGQNGHVVVELDAIADGWCVSITDDGVGEANAFRTEGSGLGRSLMETFARQADGHHRVSYPLKGCRVELTG